MNTTATQTTANNNFSWDAYKRQILGEDYTNISVSDLPEPTEFDHTVINNVIRKNNQKCNTLLQRAVNTNNVNADLINRIPFTTENSDGEYQYNHKKFQHYIKYLDMVANLKPEEKTNPNTFRKLITYYVNNIISN
jgi:hypothetical protein